MTKVSISWPHLLQSHHSQFRCQGHHPKQFQKRALPFERFDSILLRNAIWCNTIIRLTKSQLYLLYWEIATSRSRKCPENSVQVTRSPRSFIGAGNASRTPRAFRNNKSSQRKFILKYKTFRKSMADCSSTNVSSPRRQVLKSFGKCKRCWRVGLCPESPQLIQKFQSFHKWVWTKVFCKAHSLQAELRQRCSNSHHVFGQRARWLHFQDVIV